MLIRKITLFITIINHKQESTLKAILSLFIILLVLLILGVGKIILFTNPLTGLSIIAVAGVFLYICCYFHPDFFS